MKTSTCAEGLPSPLAKYMKYEKIHYSRSVNPPSRRDKRCAKNVERNWLQCPQENINGAKFKIHIQNGCHKQKTSSQKDNSAYDYKEKTAKESK